MGNCTPSSKPKAYRFAQEAKKALTTAILQQPLPVLNMGLESAKHRRGRPGCFSFKSEWTHREAEDDRGIGGSERYFTLSAS